MTYPYLKLIGGALLFYVATKLVTEDADGDDDGVEGAHTLWRAVRIVAIADIVMSLDNVIAIAATAEIAAAQVDLAHAAAIKATLIIFGLATSVPLIVAGSAILMALLERYRVLVWGGGALLGWVAGDVMVTDPALNGWFSEPVLHQLHIWGGPVGGIIVLGLGYIIVGRHRRLILDEILAGVALLVWIVVERVNETLYGGANAGLGQALGRPRRLAGGDGDRGLRPRAQTVARRASKRSERAGWRVALRTTAYVRAMLAGDMNQTVRPPLQPVRIGYSACPHDCPSTCALEVEVLDDRTIGRVRGAPGQCLHRRRDLRQGRALRRAHPPSRPPDAAAAPHRAEGLRLVRADLLG